jgi:RimJ/RimL family protein N-acetyltransferase
MEATQDDAELITLWRNTPEARRVFFSQDTVTPDTHLEFMRTKKPHNLVWMIEAIPDKVAIGTVGLDVDVRKHTAEYRSLFIAEDWRGMGYGTEMEHTILWYGFDVLRLDCMWGVYLEYNTPVAALHKKFGWTIELTFKHKMGRVCRIGYCRQDWEAWASQHA